MRTLEAYLDGLNVAVIMDNAPIHRNMDEIYPNLNVKYLPPYSPFLNPIESCFSVFKNYLKIHLTANMGACTAARAREMGTTQVALRERVVQEGVSLAIPRVTAEVAENNYRHAKAYIARYFDRVDILQ